VGRPGRLIPAILRRSEGRGRRRARIPASRLAAAFSKRARAPARFSFHQRRMIESNDRAVARVPGVQSRLTALVHTLRGKDRTRTEALARRSGFQPRPGPAGFLFRTIEMR
jgi:hypothetical protein